jgi:hypothetical protein
LLLAPVLHNCNQPLHQPCNDSIQPPQHLRLSDLAHPTPSPTQRPPNESGTYKPPLTCSLVVPYSGTHESTSTRARADAQADSCQRSTARFRSHYMSRLDDSHRGSTALLINGLTNISSLPSLNRLIHLGLPSLQLHGMAAPSRQALWEGQCGFAYRAHSTSPFPGERRRVGPCRWLIHRCQTGRGSQPHVRRLEQGVAAGAGTPHQSVTTSPARGSVTPSLQPR